MTARSQPRGTAIELLWVAPDDLHPNVYNANVLDGDMYDKAVASIRKYGFVDPVTVRLVDGQYEIIDGEHRVRAARDLLLRLVPVIIVDADDDTARELTLVLNELRGRPDQAKLQRILQGLSERQSVETLLQTLPFAREQFIAGHYTFAPALAASPPADISATRWVERMYRLPRSAADILDAALAMAKEYEEVSDDWKALQAIAQHYLEED